MPVKKITTISIYRADKETLDTLKSEIHIKLGRKLYDADLLKYIVQYITRHKEEFFNFLKEVLEKK